MIRHRAARVDAGTAALVSQVSPVAIALLAGLATTLVYLVIVHFAFKAGTVLVVVPPLVAAALGAAGSLVLFVLMRLTPGSPLGCLSRASPLARPRAGQT